MKDSSAELAAFLKSVPLFGDLSDAALMTLARVCHVQSIAKGCVLFDKDDLADTVYIIRSGCISIILCTIDGRELFINNMRKGDLVGELAVLTHSTRTATAVAHEATEVIVIPRDDFMEQLEREPKIMRRLLDVLAQRLRASSERESALAFLDAPTRLARVLLQLDYENRTLGYTTISQEGLAQHIGITRQTTAKILGQWRRKGWIVTGRGKLVVLDRNALRKISDEPEQ